MFAHEDAGPHKTEGNEFEPLTDEARADIQGRVDEAYSQFLADVDGHPDEPGLARAFEELAFFSREVNILGTYPAHAFRIETQGRAD